MKTYSTTIRDFNAAEMETAMSSLQQVQHKPGVVPQLDMQGHPTCVPFPERMPVDALRYAQTFSLTNFINAYCQIRDVLRYEPRRVLIIGVGIGLEPILLREKFGIEVRTFDIDPGFSPDVVGSVHDMSMFSEGEFDVVVASHVLEHLAFPWFSTALGELARVARRAVVYLPYGGRHLEWKFTWAQRAREWALRVRIPPTKRIDGQQPVLQAQTHYWECGYPGFSVKRIRFALAEHFRIDQMYHNHDWKYSLNFRLTSLRLAKTGAG